MISGSLLWVYGTEDVSLELDCLISQAFGKVLAGGGGFLILTPFCEASRPVKQLSVVGLPWAV